MQGGLFRARIALGWGKSLLIKRDGYSIQVTQRVSKNTFDYIMSTQENKHISFSGTVLWQRITISDSPNLEIRGLFSSISKKGKRYYYILAESGYIGEISTIERTNQYANEFKKIITKFNKEHKNEEINNSIS